MYFDKILLSGPLNNHALIIDEGEFIFVNNNIKTEGIINFKEYIFNIDIIFDQFKHDKYSISSGIANIKSPFFFENIKANIDLFDIQLDSLNIDSLNGMFIYNTSELLTAEMNIFSNTLNGLIKVKSFNNLNNYNILGDINIHDYDIAKHIKIKGMNYLTGNVNFNYNTTNNNGQIEIISKNLHGCLLSNHFDKFTGKINIQVKDNHFSGLSHGKFNNWKFANYKWEDIEYHIEIINSKISSFNFLSKGDLGDYINLKAKSESSNNLYVSNFSGNLKQVPISADPFYLILDKDKIILPK